MQFVHVSKPSLKRLCTNQWFWRTKPMFTWFWRLILSLNDWLNLLFNGLEMVGSNLTTCNFLNWMHRVSHFTVIIWTQLCWNIEPSIDRKWGHFLYKLTTCGSIRVQRNLSQNDCKYAAIFHEFYDENSKMSLDIFSRRIVVQLLRIGILVQCQWDTL